MVYSMRFRIEHCGLWNHVIFSKIEKFIVQFDKAPHIILTNAATARQIDIAMSTEIVAEGLVNEFREIAQFACKLTVLDFCLDQELEMNEFILVYDDDAELVDAPDELEVEKPIPDQEKRQTGT